MLNEQVRETKSFCKLWVKLLPKLYLAKEET